MCRSRNQTTVDSQLSRTSNERFALLSERKEERESSGNYNCRDDFLKYQALDVIKLLKGKIPIERAQMKLKVHFPTEEAATIKEQLSKLSKIEKEDNADDRITCVCLIDPGNFRSIDELIKKGKGGIEVLNLAVTEEGEAKVQ
jgi:hypothetical protein